MYNQAPNLTLVLTKVDDLTYTGSLSELWTTAVNLIRTGYKVVADNGESYGIITAIKTTTITITTTTGFKSQSYLGGSWQLYVPTVTDLQNFIPELFDNTKLIPELFEALQNQVDEVDDSVLRLNYSKDYNKTSNELLARTLADIGIKFYKAVSNETLRRLVQESITYEITSGRKIGLDYIGISLGVELSYSQLWTNDYIHFYSKEEIPETDLDKFYPTNYVRIYYDNLNTNIDEQTIRDMFYQLAWICNIIYDIIYAITLNAHIEYLNTGILPSYTVYFNNADTEMQNRLDNSYLDDMPMPPTNEKYT